MTFGVDANVALLIAISRVVLLPEVAENLESSAFQIVPCVVVYEAVFIFGVGFIFFGACTFTYALDDKWQPPKGSI